jgi:UDP-N-acetylglucosamine transferase subunit ALG13
MIFVTTGMEKYPFPRLLKAVSEAAREGIIPWPVIVQSGSTFLTSPYLDQRSLFAFPDMVAMMEQAEVVIGHAGAGTMLLAQQLGRRPLLMPRNSQFGEHLDNHQQDFANRLDGSERAHIARDEATLKRLLRELLMTPDLTRFTHASTSQCALTEHIRQRIATVARGPSISRTPG